ncbi:MAG: hypothetical protein SPI30_02705 [Prevotella sp.]|nr:hypothetical protein [Prevotella sp.]
MKKQWFHPRKVFSGNGTKKYCHRTKHWYGSYRSLVATVPFVGTVRTNEWYQLNTAET